VLPIRSQPTGSSPGEIFPPVSDRELIRIELNISLGIFNVDEDVTFFIGDREFGFSSQGNRPGDRSSPGIDDRGIVTEPLNARPAWKRGRILIASGFYPGGAVPRTFRVFTSKIVTLLSRRR